MIWTLLILVLAIALYVFGGKFIKSGNKKAGALEIVMHKGLNVIAIILIAGCVCRVDTNIFGSYKSCNLARNGPKYASSTRKS